MKVIILKHKCFKVLLEYIKIIKSKFKNEITKKVYNISPGFILI
jgi:hypothetical protein